MATTTETPVPAALLSLLQDNHKHNLDAESHLEYYESSLYTRNVAAMALLVNIIENRKNADNTKESV